MLTLLKKISYTVLILSLWSHIPPPVYADELTASDQEELDQLMKLLDKHTEIATQTRMNADYIPGMVTVLQGEELESRGFRSLAEALTLVPGLDVSISNGGTPGLVSRGIGNSYAASTSMILLNGTPMNSAFSGSGNGVASVPIEQVERIEVIRGPGGAINGEFAYSGIINIITRTDSNRLFGATGRFSSYSAGGMVTYQDEQQEKMLSVNLASYSTDGANHYEGPDGFGHFGVANEARESLTGFATMKINGFTLLGHVVKGGQGEFFGVMPVGNMIRRQEEIVSRQHYKTVEARQQLEITPDFDLHCKAGWQEYQINSDPLYLAYEGYVYPPYTYSNGVQYAMHAQEQKYFATLDSTWRGWQNHSLMAGISFTYNEMKELWAEANFDPVTYAPTSWNRFSGTNNIIVPEDAHRHLTSLSLQDEYSITDTIHLTTGLRYDYYNDVGESFTPRIAGVWTPAPHHIFKAQYARAFRPPTLLELYGNQNFIRGNKDITPEKVDTFELGYILRQDRRTAKATIFYSDHHDLIVIRAAAGGSPNFEYTNSGGATQCGVELELREQLHRSLLFDGNLSYVRTRDSDTKKNVTGARNWLANAGLIYSPFSWTSLACQYRYVGKQHRAPGDSRATLKPYNVVDLTLSLFPSQLPGLTLRSGVNNIFSEDVRCASSASSGYEPYQGYPNDLPTQDRFWWVQCAYEM